MSFWDGMKLWEKMLFVRCSGGETQETFLLQKDADNLKVLGVAMVRSHLSALARVHIPAVFLY